MILPFTLDQLKAFVLVLDTGSFSAAAQHLGVSQPAVSAQVRELERKMGTRLLERVGRTVGPTSAGVTLAGHARTLLDAGQQAAEAVSQHMDGVSGTVRMGTGATACLHLLPPLLQRIRRDHASPFVLTLCLLFLGYTGLGISLWPNVIPPDISIWQAAGPAQSLSFALVGALAIIPVILMYTAWSYWVFRGKVRHGDGYH